MFGSKNHFKAFDDRTPLNPRNIITGRFKLALFALQSIREV